MPTHILLMDLRLWQGLAEPAHVYSTQCLLEQHEGWRLESSEVSVLCELGEVGIGQGFNWCGLSVLLLGFLARANIQRAKGGKDTRRSMVAVHDQVSEGRQLLLPPHNVTSVTFYWFEVKSKQHSPQPPATQIPSNLHLSKFSRNYLSGLIRLLDSRFALL